VILKGMNLEKGDTTIEWDQTTGGHKARERVSSFV